mgnify:CR=1 FL=1
MKSLFLLLKVISRLGIGNVARVLAYRTLLRMHVHPVLKLVATLPPGPYFAMLSGRAAPAGLVASQAWRDSGLWFSAHSFFLDGPPDWHANPFRLGVRAESEARWDSIPDFISELGDIKAVWEGSRFGWAIPIAQRAALGETSELGRLNKWLEDWARNNPAYYGVNWKCGQEASIRVMHLAAAALILGVHRTPLPALRELIAAHLARIAPTIGYAIGQANNHGTSEAAALFIGGSWVGGREGANWAATGRRWLEDRARRLIGSDGTFSQYSPIYHRVMLDTYALAEIWRRSLNLPVFSDILHERLRAATVWLQAMMIEESGDVPNIGANDGSRLLPLTDTDYRDFRPSLQLAATLFLGARIVDAPGPWDQPLYWFGVDRPNSTLPPPRSVTLDDGGFHILRIGTAMAVLRYPRFRFRPSQADALHLDLWSGGRNILRDAGSFSYASEEGAWFTGTSAHNTAEFDGRDQMPRLGRFLFGAWLKAYGVASVREDGRRSVAAAAGYRDAWRAHHHRQVTLRSDGLECTDRLGGNARKAVLRWRLAPGHWRLSGSVLTDGKVSLCVCADRPLALRLTQAPDSRYYFQREDVPVLEVEATLPATLTTHVEF